MPLKTTGERLDVDSKASSLTFFATASGNKSVFGKAADLNGYVEIAWDRREAIAADPRPQMHVEFLVEHLRSGNELKDREMWKMIDSKRFPKIVADLSELSLLALPGSYNAVGQITMAGLSRTYEGKFSVKRDGGKFVLDGYLQVDVRDFGLKPVKLLTLSVEPVVKVHLHLVAA
jgi:YceI-like domain